MIETGQFIFILTSAIVLLSALICFLFAIFNFNKSFIHKGISFLFFFIFFRFLTTHLYLNGFIFAYPHFLLVVSAAARLVIPMLFLLVWYPVSNKKFSKTHLLHLIPFALFIFDFLPIFMLSGEEKHTLLLQVEKVGYSIVLQNGAFFPTFLTNVFRLGIPLGYILAIGYLVFKDRNFIRVPIPLQRIFVLIFFFLLFNITPVVAGFFGNKLMDSPFGVNLLGLVVSFVFLLAMFFMPKFLYGYQLSEPTKSSGPGLYEGSFSNQIESDSSKSLLPVKTDLLFSRIESFFEKEKPYLKPDLSLRYLEIHLHLSGRYISQSIKAHTGMAFKDYVQQKRMEYFYTEYQYKLGEEGKSIEEVAYDLGFISVNTFYVRFKQSTGMTPKEYFDQCIKAPKVT